MAGELDHIKSELDLFSSRRGPAALIPAVVLSVDESDNTITVRLDNDAEIDDVQLRSVVKTGSKIIIVPAVDSVVLIAPINNSDEYYVVAVEAFEKVVIKKETFTVEVTEKIKIENAVGNLKDAFINIIEATEQIVVLQGNNPNYVKLAQAKIAINSLMN
jgi:hypothetical protein